MPSPTGSGAVAVKKTKPGLWGCAGQEPHLAYALRELRGDQRVPLGEVGNRAVAATAKRRLGPHQRVVAHIEPEHLLFQLESLGLVELEVRNRDSLVVRGIDCAGLAEEAHHPLVALATASQGHVDDLLADHQQSPAGMAQGVERAGLDE